jgi:hypothetical protein
MTQAFNWLFKADCIRNPVKGPKGGWKAYPALSSAVVTWRASATGHAGCLSRCSAASCQGRMDSAAQPAPAAQRVTPLIPDGEEAMIRLELDREEAEQVIDALDARTTKLSAMGPDWSEDAAECEAIRVRLEMEVNGL